MRKYLAITTVVLLTISQNAYSEVNAINFLLECDASGTATVTYQTPPGKVLILEHIIRVDPTPEVRCTLYQAGLLTYVLCSGSPEHTTFSPAYLIVGDADGGGELTLVNGSNDTAVVTGRLADQADMYAAIPSEILDTEYANNSTMELLIGLDSPRPSILGVEESVDLRSWLDAEIATIAHGAGEHSAFVLMDKDMEFFRAKARSRK